MAESANQHALGSEFPSKCFWKAVSISSGRIGVRPTGIVHGYAVGMGNGDGNGCLVR